MRHISWTVAGILIVLLIAIYVDLPGTNAAFGRNIGIQKGIDIAGGVRVLECTKQGTHPSSTDMSTARDVINSRVSGGFGVTEPQVSQVGSNCIAVEVPGVGQNKQQQIIDTIGKTGFLALTDSGSTF